MNDDQDIFDQLDRLQSGARVLDASYEPRRENSTAFAAYDGYDGGYHTQASYAESYAVATDYHEDAPLQLDAFGECCIHHPSRETLTIVEISVYFASLTATPGSGRRLKVMPGCHCLQQPRSLLASVSWTTAFTTQGQQLLNVPIYHVSPSVLRRMASEISLQIAPLVCQVLLSPLANAIHRHLRTIIRNISRGISLKLGDTALLAISQKHRMRLKYIARTTTCSPPIKTNSHSSHP